MNRFSIEHNTLGDSHGQGAAKIAEEMSQESVPCHVSTGKSFGITINLLEKIRITPLSHMQRKGTAMVAAEFSNSVSTVRIHDEYCEVSVDHRISHLGHIISASYKRRQLSNQKEQPSLEIAAASVTARVLES